MSKSKRKESPQSGPIAGRLEGLLKTNKWWFEDQSEINNLITDAIDGDLDDKRALRLYMDFVRRGYAGLGRLIPEQMAKSSKVGNVTVQSGWDAIVSYPTILAWLEDFLDAKPVISPSQAPNESDIIAYVAAANTCGMRTGEVIVCDAARPWDMNGEGQFVGLTIYYRKAVE